ncbi:MAG: flavoprotein [Candidatus Paceibacterota bacterium]|jgi:phosphopantothenoylcysteine decarboxylase
MKVLLCVTGSVAATLAPKIEAQLAKHGHEVKTVVTFSSMYFLPRWWFLYLWSVLFSKLVALFLPPGVYKRILSSKTFWTDFDEWPGLYYRKSFPVMHIFLRDWADVILVAPATANSIRKFAEGASDNLVSSVVCAARPGQAIVLAPAMNTFMFLNLATKDHLKVLTESRRFEVVNPVSKRLACGDTGLGAMANISDIMSVVNLAK